MDTPVNLRSPLLQPGSARISCLLFRWEAPCTPKIKETSRQLPLQKIDATSQRDLVSRNQLGTVGTYSGMKRASRTASMCERVNGAGERNTSYQMRGPGGQPQRHAFPKSGHQRRLPSSN